MVKGYLDKVGIGFEERGVNVRLEIRSGGKAEENPADEIIKFANEMHADIIVTSTNVRSYAGHWLFGSAAERLLHRGNLPILALKTSLSEADADHLVKERLLMRRITAVQGECC